MTCIRILQTLKNKKKTSSQREGQHLMDFDGNVPQNIDKKDLNATQEIGYINWSNQTGLMLEFR